MNCLQGLKKIDFSLLNWVQENLKTAMMDRVMLLFSKLGDRGTIWIVYAVICEFTTKLRHAGLVLAMCVSTCALIGNFAIKPLFKRERPCNINSSYPMLLSRPEDSSFPSCHTMTSFAAAFVTVWQAGGMLGVTSFIFASLISFSRVYLYVHYPSDVLAGAALGLATGGLFLF
ncbi:MAG: phosphatase PAP2 family protein [Synergistaceae bacterium]|nr:phosphatase PAP2 family protein [Synergistaceae bacterium]